MKCQAILSGISAGGLATILNCDKFKFLVPENARVKCIADAGFFINGKTIYGSSYIQEMYRRIVNLHGSAKNLPLACTSSMEPSLCFFPQNVVPYVQPPLFIINSIYDYWQPTAAPPKTIHSQPLKLPYWSIHVPPPYMPEPL
ncbi:Pectin acetylesterase 8 [Capsicum chinense]|nr:Pectin acetylesterase 8 [Capsicum chinense]